MINICVTIHLRYRCICLPVLCADSCMYVLYILLYICIIPTMLHTTIRELCTCVCGIVLYIILVKFTYNHVDIQTCKFVSQVHVHVHTCYKYLPVSCDFCPCTSSYIM